MPMSGSNSTYPAPARRSTVALSPFAASSRSVRATVRRRLGVHGMMPTRRLRSSSGTARAADGGQKAPRQNLSATYRSPDEGFAGTPEQWRRADCTPTDVMNNVDQLHGYEPLRRCDSRVPPKQVVKAEASRLRGVVPRIPPAQRAHPDKVQVGSGMVVQILFHQRAAKTMRDDPDAVSFGEVPSPVPCNAGFGAHVGEAGMTNYQNVQVFHLRSFQNVCWALEHGHSADEIKDLLKRWNDRRTRNSMLRLIIYEVHRPGLSPAVPDTFQRNYLLRIVIASKHRFNM